MHKDENKKKYENKEDNTMMTLNETVQTQNDIFNNFLSENLTKIKSIVPKNPSITKDDEWRKETFWDEKE